jgi:anti-sigma B factor antagonist
MALTANIRHFGNVAVVDLDGKITLGENTGILRDNLKSLLSQGTKNIVLNMAGVGYVDSAGRRPIRAAPSSCSTCRRNFAT